MKTPLRWLLLGALLMGSAAARADERELSAAMARLSQSARLIPPMLYGAHFGDTPEHLRLNADHAAEFLEQSARYRARYEAMPKDQLTPDDQQAYKKNEEYVAGARQDLKKALDALQAAAEKK